MTTAIGFVSMSALLLRLSLDSGFFGFGYSEVVFLFTEFPLCQQSGFFFFFAFKIFCCTQTHTWLFRSQIFIFQKEIKVLKDILLRV